MTIEAGPLLASLVDMEAAGATVSAGPPSCIPLIMSLAGILLAYLLTAFRFD